MVSVSTTVVSSPLLVSRDAVLIESVEATALALGVELRVVSEREAVHEQWPSAVLRLVGPDLVGRVQPFGPQPATFVIGFDQQALLRASTELSAPVILLPEGNRRLAELLTDDGPGPGAGVVVALAAASGGLGVSTLGVALAARAAESGRRAVVVDLGRGGGVDLLFGAERLPGATWDDLYATSGEVGDLSRHLVTVDGVQVLARGRREGHEPDRTAVEAVLRSLVRSHDVVVVDAGDGARLPWAGRQAQPLLVVGADVYSVAAARGRSDLVPSGVVVRRGRGREIPAGEVARALGWPLVGVIRDDPRVPRLASVGISVGSRGARRLARDTKRLLERVVEFKAGRDA